MATKLRVSSPTALIFSVLFLTAALRPYNDPSLTTVFAHILSLIQGFALGAFWMPVDRKD